MGASSALLAEDRLRDARAAPEAPDPRAAADPSQIMMVHMLHARVLQLYASHCKKHGRATQAKAMSTVVSELEDRYGFSSQ